MLVCGLLAMLCLAPGPNPRPALIRVLNGVVSETWHRDGPIEFFAGEAIYEYMNGSGEIPLACRYRDLAVGRFNSPEHGGLTIELYAMPTPADAFGLCSFRSDPERQQIELTHPGWYANGGLYGWRGCYTWSILADNTETSVEAPTQVARALEQRIEEAGEEPALLKQLPVDPIGGTVRYCHGKFALDTIWFRRDDLFDLAGGADVAAARYAEPEGLVIVAAYSSAERAEKVLRRLVTTLGLTADGAIWVGTDGARAVVAEREAERVRVAVRGR